ncbi:MAG TPA: ferrous iron transport protein B, partial [Rhodothermales bacterium]
SALGTIYSVGDADENSVALRERLRTDRDPETGALIYTPLVAVSLMVFFVLAMQCMSTLAVARRELNSWLWPAVMWGYMTGLAYLFALIVYQGGRLIGLG